MNPDDNSLCCQIIQHASKRHPADPENTAEFLFPREFVGYIQIQTPLQIQRMNILFQFRTNLRFKINLFYLFHYNHQFFLVYFLFCK